jgi:hypothetical protein
MKKVLLLVLVLTIGFLNFSKANAQSIEVGAKQSLSISSPGFFPFTPTGNTALVMVFPTNPIVTITISNFLGNTFTLAPAQNFAEIGTPIEVMGNTSFPIDFSEGGPDFSGTFGISLAPQGSVNFDITITPGEAGTSSSTSSSTTGGPVTGDLFSPDSFTVIGGFLNDSLANTLSNAADNPNCSSSQSGINSALINDTFINQLYDDLLDTNFSSQRTVIGSDDTDGFTLSVPSKKINSKGSLNVKLNNTTDKTKIYLTAIFPSTSERQSIMVGRMLTDGIDVTLKEQDLVALAAVQHAIVSATMPWQLSNNGGFFITQGGGCVGPYCTIVEQGMVVIVPGGSCTPEVLNKRKAGYPTVNPSKLFDPFISAAGVIQLPTSSIVDPSNRNVSKFVKESNYLILQPVPPGAMLIQKLNLNLKKN